MRAPAALLAAAALWLAFALPTAAADCGAVDAPCEVTSGRYYAVPPPNWDGTSELPVVVFFHGYRGSGARVPGNDSLRAAVHDAGYLLVAPDGRAGTWAHVGSPSDRRDELAYMDQVLADLKTRWPVEPARLLAIGFSQGGSMVWDLACYRGEAFTAFVAIAGGFWEPLPDSCPGGPVNLRHIHGWSDAVVPLEGRAIRQTFRQGDVLAGFTLWRRHNACDLPPDRQEDDGRLTCRIWNGCDRGGRLDLCLHDGGHSFRSGWIVDAIAWMERNS